MTVFVLSTMTNSVNYRVYRLVGDLPTPIDSVTIHGGAGIPSIKSGFGDMNADGEGSPMWTAAGVVTPVSDAKYAMLKDHELFKKHLDRGHLKVVNKDITDNHKEVKKQVATMEQKDGHAQLNDATYKQKVKVTVNSQMQPDTQFRL
jgi:hypothetical protein